MPEANSYDETIVWGVDRLITDLTADIITSIYLYGSETPPEYFGSRIRDVRDSFVVKIDQSAFFSSGPGQVFGPERFGAVQKFFDEDFTKPFELDENGVEKDQFTGNELISLGILTEGDFKIFPKHLFSHIGANNYAERTYIFNTQAIQLLKTTLFVWDNNGLHLENTMLELVSEDDPSTPEDDRDNFDFNTPNPFLQLFNPILENQIDPYRLGENSLGVDVPIIFEYVNGPFLVTNSLGQNMYSSGDYDNDYILNLLLDGGLVDATLELGPLPIIPQLEANLTINFDAQGREIIYGTNDAETLTTGVIIPNIIVPDTFHLVGGGGNDTITGSIGDDYLEGNADDDTLEGRGGGDILVGGLGSDTLIGGAGLDFLFGDEHVDEFGVNRIASAPSDADPSSIVDTADYSGAAGLFGSGITLDTTTMTQAELDAGFLLVTDDAQGGQDTVFDFEVGVDMFEIGGGLAYADLVLTASPQRAAYYGEL